MESEQHRSLVVKATAVADHTASIFDKYKQGKAHPLAPFKLCQPQRYGQFKYGPSEQKDKWAARGGYRKYTLHEKMEAVECVKNGQDINRVAERFSIPRRNLLRWKKNGCERKEGGGRPADEEMEDRVLAKILSGELTDSAKVRAYALDLSKSENFRASIGWLFKFSRRHNLKISEGQVAQSAPNGEIESTDSIPT